MNWPEELLPAPRIDFSFNDAPNHVANRMDSGAIRQRRRFINVVRGFEVTLIVNALQLGIFEAFYQQAIYNGAGRFNMKLPMPGFSTLQSVEVLIDTGSKQSEALAGNEKWQVTFTLLSDNVTRIMDNLYEILAEFSLAELEPFASFGNELYTVLDNLNLNN